MERLKVEAVEAFRTGLVLVATGLLLWALGLVGAQCLGWLRFGVWQPVPGYAVFLGPPYQVFMLVPGGLHEASWSPLMLAPSLANFGASVDVSSAISGHMVGLAKMIDGLLELPLSAWLMALSFGMLHAQARME